MPNLASTLKAEISRIARKEIRAEVGTLRKAASQHRSTIAALRRQVQALQKQLRTTAKVRPERHDETEGDGVQRRFRVGGLITHRNKLGLSREDYGRLVGVTGQTIFKWENGSHPRARQLEALAAVRGIGKREATRRLEELAHRQL